MVQAEKIDHLKDDNLVANEMAEVIPSKDIKMANQVDEAYRGDDKMKMSKEVEIKIAGNDKEREILDNIQSNLQAIACLDNLLEVRNSENSESFITALARLMLWNLSLGTHFFNQIIQSKVSLWLLVLNSQNIEDNSTECSSIGDEAGENGPFN